MIKTMNRNYVEIEKQFANTGFFSEYLPPCFELDERAFLNPPPQNCDLIPPFCFTMSRYNQNDSRRNIFIPEIGSYIISREFIKQKNIIEELIDFTETEKKSFSPILSNDGDIITHEQSYDMGEEINGISSDYIDNVAEKIIRSTGAKRILKLDISNCFASFYMHMIPSIKLGYEVADIEYNKTRANKKDPTIDEIYIKYSKLDEILRKQNLNRTNGILTGPLISKLIMEAMLTRIDKDLIRENILFSRYMDDYEIYMFNENEKEIISIFTRVLKKYGFGLNHEKTQIIDFPYYISDNLEKTFKSYINENLKITDLMELFNEYLKLEGNGVKGAIRYLLKSFEQIELDIEDSDLYMSYLITIINNNERSLTKACVLLINNKEKMVLGSNYIKIIREILTKHIKWEHDLEVLWLLYLLLETENIKNDDSIILEVAESDNDLAQILLLNNEMFDATSVTIIKEKASSWILLYELYALNHIDEAEFKSKLNLNKNINMYKHFKNEGIHFIKK